MTATTVQSTTESNVPVYKVGDGVHPSLSPVARIHRLNSGAQTVWLEDCPSWCGGHVPVEQVEDIAEYDWTLHTACVETFLPSLAGRSGQIARRAGHLALDLAQTLPGAIFVDPVDRVAQIGVHLSSDLWLTPGEARSLAAQLVRLADVMEA